MMNAPRCGMPDIVATEDREGYRQRRFNAQGSRWITPVRMFWYCLMLLTFCRQRNNVDFLL